MSKNPPGHRCAKLSDSRWFARILALAAVTVSGCTTGSEFARGHRAAPLLGSDAGTTTNIALETTIGQSVHLARLQSPAGEVAEDPEALAPIPLPTFPDQGSSTTATDRDAASVTPRLANPAISRDSRALGRLSSIARNRMANRGVVASRLDSVNAMSDGADGSSTPGPANPRLGGLTAILRNRIEDSVDAGEEPQFRYPDIHSDPAKSYHDRFGLDEEHDRFLFPWVMNLIFEDRWLLAESDPKKALENQLRRRMKIDIRDPDPDTANFPNGAYTLPKGRLYIENSPVGFYGASKTSPRIYQWESLVRYGLTDNLEFRIFSNGLSVQAAKGKQPATTGYSPVAFDFKANFWEENTKYHIPAMGVEMYIQTTFGSPAFNGGAQPSLNLLFDQSLPLGIGFEYNVGIAGVQNGRGETVYEFSFQWSFQREVVKDFDVFVHGFYNAASLPRLINFQGSSENNSIPSINVAGIGGIWTVNDRLAVFGSYNFGTTTGSPKTIALTGFAVAF